MLFTDNLTWSPTHELIFLFSYFAYFRNVIAHILVIERLNATLSFKKYERSRGPFFTIWWLIIVNLLTFGTVYGTSATSSTTFINLCFWAIMFVLAVIELIGIMFLRKYNDQIYTNRSFVNATLSERYQLAENIRTTKQLIPILAIHFFNIALGTFVNWTTYYQAFGPLNSSIFAYELFNQIYMLIIAFTSFLIELTMILRHQVTPASITNNAIENTNKKRAVSLTSVQGLELLPCGGGDQTEEYFTQLQVMWARKR
uniref:7TM_GPCR_Srx domain-containing protein n=1 Tax=Meloidogyne hapla TaxID=6305 RepID=A0A1I8BA16_MELHA